MNNPYSAPESIQNVLPPTRSRRPISVWLALLLFAVFGAIFANAFNNAIAHWTSDATVIENRIVIAVDVVWRLMLMAIVAGALYGIWQRRQWARWLGIFVLVAVAVFSIFGQDSTSYTNDAQRAGGAFGRFFIFPMLLLWWSYAFGFSEKSKLYWD